MNWSNQAKVNTASLLFAVVIVTSANVQWDLQPDSFYSYLSGLISSYQAFNQFTGHAVQKKNYFH